MPMTASVSIIPKTRESIQVPIPHSVSQSIPPAAPTSFFPGNAFNSSPLARMIIPPGTRLPNFSDDAVPNFKTAPADKTPSPDHGRSLLRSNRSKQHAKSASIRARESLVPEPPSMFDSKSEISVPGPSKAAETSSDASSRSVLSFGPLPSSGPVRNPLKYGFTAFGNTSPASSNTASPTPVSNDAPSFTFPLVPPIVKPSSLPPRTPSPEDRKGPVSRSTPPNTPPSLLSRLRPPPTAQQRKEAGAQLINLLAESDVNDDGQGEESGVYEHENEDCDEDEGDGTEYDEGDGDDGEWQPDEGNESDSTEDLGGI